MKGLANEVPIFIETYEPQDEDKVAPDGRRPGLAASRVRRLVAVVDLFDLILEQLEEEGRLQQILEREPTLGKQKMLELDGQPLRPEDAADSLPHASHRRRGRPAGAAHRRRQGLPVPAHPHHPRVASAGHGFATGRHVLPGQYEHDENGASVLRLFGSLASPPIYRPYYRAFNLAHYRL